MSWWGVKSGRAGDCGCYGGYVQPSIGQSLAINASMAVVVVAALLLRAPGSSIDGAKLALSVLALIAVAGFAFYAQRFEEKEGRPLIDTNPLKVGQKWNHSWAGGATKGRGGELLISYLGPDCSFCSTWVRVGNAIDQGPTLPTVIGVMGISAERRDSYVRERQIRFEVSTIGESMMSRLAPAVPTTVLVEDGIIRQTWSGTPPVEFVQRFRDAFFPSVGEVRTDANVPAATRVS